MLWAWGNAGCVIGLVKAIRQPVRSDDGEINEVERAIVIHVADQYVRAVVITGVAAQRVRSERLGGTIGIAICLVRVHDLPAVVAYIDDSIAIGIRNSVHFTF